MDDQVFVCRCEEVTLAEVKKAIREGARDITGVKRRTRAGMGLCQGRTCETLIEQVLRQELGMGPESVEQATARPPVQPISFGLLGEVSRE
jgi:NAD(P)H-nitrite reductase large subunit